LVDEESVARPPVRLMPGVSEVIPTISLPMAVWTNTRREREADVLRWLNGTGVEKLFSSIVTSVDAGARKPAAEFFQFALARWERQKEEVLFVCNQLNTDVLGASQCGIQTAWISAPEFRSKDETLDLRAVQPTFVLSDLAALPELLKLLALPG
jgi:FMN phosphatase YigB (HAD superfamily)